MKKFFLAALLVCGAAPALAQDDSAEPQDEVIVTGSEEESFDALAETDMNTEGLRYKYIRCESKDNLMRRCSFGRDRGSVRTVRLIDQRSRAACIPNITWGATNSFVWVGYGCRATFRLTID